MENIKLIKIDKNGSKHYEAIDDCPRCGGTGHYSYNALWNTTCMKCEGVKKIKVKWIERTPEYQAKLDAKNKKKAEERAVKMAEAIAEKERIKAEREAQEKARKSISQFIGSIDERLKLTLSYVNSFSFKQTFGWKEQTTYIHIFKDADSNVIIWKTSSPLGIYDGDKWDFVKDGDKVTLNGTVKEHKLYKDEKQTVLTRCKVVNIAHC